MRLQKKQILEFSLELLAIIFLLSIAPLTVSILQYKGSSTPGAQTFLNEATDGAIINCLIFTILFFINLLIFSPLLYFGLKKEDSKWVSNWIPAVILVGMPVVTIFFSTSASIQIMQSNIMPEILRANIWSGTMFGPYIQLFSESVSIPFFYFWSFIVSLLVSGLLISRINIKIMRLILIILLILGIFPGLFMTSYIKGKNIAKYPEKYQLSENLCKKIGDSYDRATCYKNLAESLSDINICEKISEAQYTVKESCKTEFCVKLKNESCCATISNRDNIKGIGRDECYRTLCFGLNNPECCDKIEGEWSKGECYREAGLGTIEVCLRLNSSNCCYNGADISIKKECFTQLCLQSKISEADCCNTIKDDHMKRDCESAMMYG